MTFSPSIAKDKLAGSTDDQIRSLSGKTMTAEERDPEWDKALEARVALMPTAGVIINDIKNTAIVDDRSKDKDILSRYSALQSDIERIAVFNSGTRVEESQITANKPRLKAIFMFLGPEFQKAHKRAKDGKEIKPYNPSDIAGGRKSVNYV